ncbi:MAG: glycogen-binding domain-containing protein [Gemmatimonadota bacterium]
MNDERDDRLRDLLGELREDFRAPPDLKHNVMRRVREIPDPLWKRAFDWILRPRTIHVTPATAGLAFAGLALLFVLRPGSDGAAPAASGAPAGVATAEAPAEEADGSVTRFVFVAPSASSVRMTGDFVSWDPEGIPLEDGRGTGVWTVDVPLTPGVYQYTFIVDGTEWRPDPHAVSQVDDGFGQQNSVVIVSGNSEA